MKTKKLIALAVAVLTITMAFVPNAKAVTWSFTTQSTESYTTYGSCAVNRYMRQHFRGISSGDAYYSYYNDIVSNDSAITSFSYDTYKMVEKFQDKEPNLATDGAVGSATWNRMGSHAVQSSSGGNTQSMANIAEPNAATLYYYVPSYYTSYTSYANCFRKIANLWAVRRSLANTTYYTFS